jgi:hypothetical protein
MTSTFPFWRDRWEAMLRVNDFVIAAHMGMLIQRTVLGEARTAQLGKMIEQFAASLYQS